MPEPQSRSELGLEICSRPPLLSSGHSSLRMLNLCISWAFPPIPSWQLHRAQTTTACHPASPVLHEPSARSPNQPSATQFSKHHHACTHHADRVAPSHTKPQHKAGGNHPFLLAEAVGNPSATQPCTKMAQPSRRQDASGILVGWMGHKANRCLHNWRVMGSVDRAGHAVEMRWVGRVDDREKKALSYQLTLRKQG